MLETARGRLGIRPISARQRDSVIPISHKGQNAKLPARKAGGTGTGAPKNGEDFASANRNAKLVRAIANLVRRARLDYEGFRRLSADVRKEVGLRRPTRSRRLPQILPETSLKRFFDAIREGGDLQHEIMLKLLFYTAIRVSELVSIRVEQVDLDACKIFIEQGKGAKDRYILYPESFRLILKSHLAANPENRYLFESRQRTKYTTRRVQQIVAGYAAASDLPERIHPHLLRHQMLTWLTAQGLPDSQIQLISGHASKKSLEVYQHLSLASVQPGYQRAVKGLEV
jgi:integrase/recombinase XerD